MCKDCDQHKGTGGHNRSDELDERIYTFAESIESRLARGDLGEHTARLLTEAGIEDMARKLNVPPKKVKNRIKELARSE